LATPIAGYVKRNQKVWTICPRLAFERSFYFSVLPTVPVTPNWSLKQLAAFVSDPLISGMEESCMVD